MSERLPSPEDPITPAEEAEASELANTLDETSAPKPLEETHRSATADLLEVVNAARAATGAHELTAEEHARLFAKAEARLRFRRNRWTAAVATLAAAAATIFFVATRPAQSPHLSFGGDSTEPLFQAPLSSWTPSQRLDRIASHRTRAFRDRRFEQWGVR